MFARIGLDNHATRQGLYPKSLVYMAQTRSNRNFVPSLTVDNLRLRDTISTDLHSIILPPNA